MGIGKDIPPLQDFNSDPILVGSDVSALYPNLEKVVTGALMYEAVKSSKIKFDGVDFNRLAVYLFLTIGVTGMYKCGLEHCIPVRRGGHSNANSLAPKYNREMDGWICKDYNYDENIRMEMLARMVQLETMTLMSSSCYSFGGDLYLQLDGAGIGERGSACIAIIIMSMWDKLWAQSQMHNGLISPLFIRYVDDIRQYLFPINEGWCWNQNRWYYNPDKKDDRTQEERTVQELCKSLSSILPCIDLTMETQGDFENNFLPTLDLQTHVRSNGEIEYKYFSKPMASGLVIQKGTALSQQTIFSSLRQDLVRRLLNTSDHIDQHVKVDIVEQYIQSLVNSGHRYSFVKAIVLQALTRYEYMRERSSLSKGWYLRAEVSRTCFH